MEVYNGLQFETFKEEDINILTPIMKPYGSRKPVR